MKYQVFVSCQLSKMVEIEAGSEKEAEGKVKEIWNHTEEIEFSNEDYVHDSFQFDFAVEV